MCLKSNRGPDRPCEVMRLPLLFWWRGNQKLFYLSFCQTNFHLELFFKVKSSESTEERAVALARPWSHCDTRLRTRACGDERDWTRLREASPGTSAAPRPLLVDRLKVSVVAITGIFNSELFWGS